MLFVTLTLWLAEGRSVRPRLNFLGSDLPPLHADWNQCCLELVSARGRHGAVILHLGYLGHSSWRPDRIDARRSLDLTEKVLASYMLEVKLCVVSRNFIKKHREQKRAVVGAADD